MSSCYWKAMVSVAVMAITCSAAECDSGQQTTKNPGPGEIVVHLKGSLSVAATRKSGAEPNARPQDDSAWEIASAQIRAGGAGIELDWSRSAKIRNELFWWRLPRHGDFRQVQAEVTGRMQFRPAAESQRSETVSAGVADDARVPVVIVESLRVRLVGPDGEPRGPQPDRPVVTAN